MKYLKFIPILLMLCSTAYATPTVSSVSIESGGVVITGADFSTRTDNNVASQDYLCVGWDDFESGNKDDVFYCTAYESLTQSGVRTGTQCIARSNGSSVAGIGFNSSSTNGGYLTDFWMKIPTSTTFPPTNSQVKIIRIGNASYGYPNITWGKHEFDDDRQHIGTIEGGSDPALAFNQYLGNTDLYDDGAWHHIRAWFKPSTGVGNTDGEIKWYVDNTELLNTSTARTDGDSKNTFNGQWKIIAYYLGADGDMLIDDVCLDYTQSQVYLCNASTLATSTHVETQLVKEWADGSITYEENAGTFETGDTAYIVVVDSDGNESAGYETTVGLRGSVSPGINGAVIIKGAVTITP